MREITLREIADTTRINIRYLQALEEERFDILPAPIFAKGFLREYARFVGIDPDEAVTFYLSSIQQESDSAPAEEGRPTTGGVSSPWATTLALLSLILLILAVIAAMAYWSEEKVDASKSNVEVNLVEETRPLADSIPPPRDLMETGIEDPVEVPSSEAPLYVTLEFLRQCWVEADVDGRPAVRELKVAGEALFLEAERNIGLKLGDAQAVTLEVNGKEYPIESTSGGVFTLELTPPDLSLANEV